ncbi:ROBO4 protein, partial [Scytalopus superciliaris]|nr:ROBO4 protein [Scytalopus superciliaris]
TVLRDNFRLQPGDLVTTAGQALELDCVPPSGHPEPRITWKKDGVTLDLVGDRYVVTNGKLRVAPAQRSDSGLYICVAANAAGKRESRGARVSVLEWLPTGRHETAPRDLLAVRLHLDNATALPTAAVQLHWQMLMPVPLPVGFVVLYRSLLPATTSWVQHDAGRELSTIIPALRRGYKYEFKVRPSTGGTQGSDSNSRHVWIPEKVPSAAPQYITVGQAEMGNGTVVVSWEPPPPEAHNGVIRGYQVWSVGEGWQHHTNRTVDGGTHRLETLLPHPGVEFCVQVAAFNGAGLGVPSNVTCGILGRGWGASNTGGTLVGLTAGSSGVVQALRQPAVIAAAGSMLWLALLALLLLLCQRRASQDAAARRRLVATDSPWLGGPWKPSCAPRNLSSSSSLSSRLLGSDGRDPHPSRPEKCAQDPNPMPGTLVSWDPPPWGQGTPSSAPMGALTSLTLPALSLEPPSLGPPTPPNRSSLRRGHPPPPGEMGCCSGGHPGVRTSPSTPNPAPWEQIRKRDFGQAARWPQRRGHEGDSTPAIMNGEDGQLPVFSSPKPCRGSASLASGVIRSSETPSRLSHAWHPPVTRYLENMPPAMRQPKDTSQAIRHPKEVSPVTGHQRDMFLGTRYPKNLSPATSHTRDTSLETRHPRDRSPVTGRLSPAFSDGVLTQQQVAEDLEMNQDTTCLRYLPQVFVGQSQDGSTYQCHQCPHHVLHRPPAPTTPQSFSPLHTYGYIYGPPASELGEEEEEEGEEEEEEEEEEQTATKGSPGASLLNGWGSVSEDNFASARCSLVSSCDGSFLLDASFARALAVAVDGLCYSLEDTE